MTLFKRLKIWIIVKRRKSTLPKHMEILPYNDKKILTKAKSQTYLFDDHMAGRCRY